MIVVQLFTCVTFSDKNVIQLKTTTVILDFFVIWSQIYRRLFESKEKKMMKKIKSFTLFYSFLFRREKKTTPWN